MAKSTGKNKQKTIASGHDPFNGEVYLYSDGKGYWIENFRTGHVSDYLQDAAGKLVATEAEARKCFEAEISNAQFVGAIYP